MKNNKLLLTTALVAAFSASNAMAEIARNSNNEITKITDETKTSAIIKVPNGTTETIAANAVISGNKNNSEGIGGAIYTAKYSGHLIVKEGAVFQNNTSVYDGGAIGNYGSLALYGVTFDNNHAQTLGGEDANPIGGGAISLGIDSATDITINKTVFTNNDSGYNGGAIATRTTLQGGETGARNSLKIANSVFENNHANGGVSDKTYNQGTGGFGGAIANTFDTTQISSSEFNHNYAKVYGGAIYNAKYLDVGNTPHKISENYGGVISIKDSVFKDNIADSEGGAIYNATGAKLNLSGTNTFSNNKAAGKLNDIHNNGTVNIAGDLILDGGIKGTGVVNFLDGSSLKTALDGRTAIEAATITGSTNLVIDTGTTSGSIALAGDITKFSFASNSLYNIVDDGTGKFDISKKATSEIAASTGATATQAATLAAVTEGTSSHAVFSQIADHINGLLQTGNSADAHTAVTLATVLAPEVAPTVQQTSTETINQVFGAVGTRLSGGSIASAVEGQSSGDEIFERAAMWVQGLINKSKLDDTRTAKGFDADTNGVAFGVEKYINDNLKAGIGYAYSQTDIDGFMRTTDVDTHTALVYGEYKLNNWFVNGIATYGWSDYNESKNVAGIKVKSDYDVNTYGLQFMTGYNMNINGFGVTPETGLRYVHIAQDAYKDTAGQRISANDSEVITGVLGAKVAKSWELDNGATITPEVKFAMTYDLQNDATNSVVSLANGSAYTVRGEALNRMGWELGAGVTAELNDNVELSLGYEGKFREHYEDHTGMINAKYKF